MNLSLKSVRTIDLEDLPIEINHRSNMKSRQQEFLTFAYESGALQFGEFVLNSGRTSPYFMNTGSFSNGVGLGTLSGFYAAAIAQRFINDFMLYGPAYKGIPLAAATAMSLHLNHARCVPFAFDRKEAKDHGEFGWIVGAPLAGDVVIVEDVITSGLSIDKAVHTIVSQGANPVAVVISLDRMERTIDSNRSAVQSVQAKHQLEVLSLATYVDLLEFVDNVTELHTFVKPIEEYGREFVTV